MADQQVSLRAELARRLGHLSEAELDSLEGVVAAELALRSATALTGLLDTEQIEQFALLFAEGQLASAAALLDRTVPGYREIVNDIREALVDEAVQCIAQADGASGRAD